MKLLAELDGILVDNHLVPGDKIFYSGDKIKRPPGIAGVHGTVVSVDGDIVTFNTSSDLSKEFLFSVLKKDCKRIRTTNAVDPEWTLSTVERTRAGSWTK